MKKLFIVFGILAIVLSDIMCATVAYTFCNLKWLGAYGQTSAPASVAFVYVIPYMIGITVCIVLSVIFWKKRRM